MKRIAYDQGEQIVYKDWTIIPTSDPWAIMYGYLWECFNDDRVVQFRTLDECYEFIDDLNI